MKIVMSFFILLCLFFEGSAWGDEKKDSFIVEAGPIWNNDHAQGRCPEVLNEWLQANEGKTARWTGQWRTTIEGEMSVCEFEMVINGVTGDKDDKSEIKKDEKQEEKKPVADKKEEDQSPSWAGEYCNPNGCISIENVQETPSGLVFDFKFTLDGKDAGEGTAKAEERTATFKNLKFVLKMSDKLVSVTRNSEAEDVSEEEWSKKCIGTYMRN